MGQNTSSTEDKFKGLDLKLLKNQLETGLEVFHQKWLQCEIDVRHYERERLKPVPVNNINKPEQVGQIVHDQREQQKFHESCIRIANEILNEITNESGGNKKPFIG